MTEVSDRCQFYYLSTVYRFTFFSFSFPFLFQIFINVSDDGINALPIPNMYAHSWRRSSCKIVYDPVLSVHKLTVHICVSTSSNPISDTKIVYVYKLCIRYVNNIILVSVIFKIILMINLIIIVWNKYWIF